MTQNTTPRCSTWPTNSPRSPTSAFLFSTTGVPAFGFSQEFMRENHTPLREKLQSKGYTIVDEFSCVGCNTNSFLKRLGGINKGRPNAQDLQDAAAFARKLAQGALDS